MKEKRRPSSSRPVSWWLSFPSVWEWYLPSFSILSPFFHLLDRDWCCDQQKGSGCCTCPNAHFYARGIRHLLLPDTLLEREMHWTYCWLHFLFFFLLSCWRRLSPWPTPFIALFWLTGFSIYSSSSLSSYRALLILSGVPSSWSSVRRLRLSTKTREREEYKCFLVFSRRSLWQYSRIVERHDMWWWKEKKGKGQKPTQVALASHFSHRQTEWSM